MTNEEFYGAALADLKRAEERLLDAVRCYAEAADPKGQIRSIVYCCSRIKSPESVLRKCSLRGIGQTAQAALENLFDLVGIRIVVAFSADVYRLAGWLKARPNEKLIRGELKRCADEIASVDLSMQTIREIIQESLLAAEQEGGTDHGLSP